MKKITVILIIFLAALTGTSCGKKNTRQEPEKKLPIVKVKQIQSEKFTESFRVVGVVKPVESAKLSSEEGGIITYLAKDKGSRVSRGEVLVKLKKDVDEASYAQALAQYELAKENYERTQSLFKDNVATEQQFINSKLQLEIAIKAVELFKTRLGKGYIVSPISGVVDEKYMQKGEMTGPGSPIISVVDISSVKITAGIPERYMGKVSKGDRVKITFDVFPDEEFDGIINFVSPVLNAQNRTFEIEVKMNNKSGKLKPEMSANVYITVRNIDNAIVLEQDLIVDNGEEKFVFILEGDLAKKRIVKLDGRSDNKVNVEEGLNDGDNLIYIGFQSLTDGDKVKVLN